MFLFQVLHRKTPSSKLRDAGIKFEVGDRNLLTLTSVVSKTKKKYILPLAKPFTEEDVKETENGKAATNAVASTSTEEVLALPAPPTESTEKSNVY